MGTPWRSANTKGLSLTDRRFFLVRAFFTIAVGATVLGVPCAHAQSGTYPDRLISIVVPFTPGSAADILARIFASELTTDLGQNVIVENKTGAGGSMGTTAVARAKNDGYTLLVVSNSTIAINPALYRNLTFDPIKDFTPVIKLASTPNLLLVPAQSPASSAQDLIRRMKEREKQNARLQYNSIGNGTTQHLLGVLFAKLVSANADHVPYRSVPDQLTALVSGQVDFGFCALPSSVSFVKSGRLRALGTTSTVPLVMLPDVPTLSSAGLKEFDKTNLWFGVVAPKDLPEAVRQTLHRAFATALDKQAIQKKLAAMGFDAAPAAPASEFAQLVRDQVAFWAGLVKMSGASND